MPENVIKSETFHNLHYIWHIDIPKCVFSQKQGTFHSTFGILIYIIIRRVIRHIICFAFIQYFRQIINHNLKLHLVCQYIKICVYDTKYKFHILVYI